MPGSKENLAIKKLNIYDNYNNLYLSQKEFEEKPLQKVQSANVLRVQVGALKTGDTAITVTASKNEI